MIRIVKSTAWKVVHRKNIQTPISLFLPVQYCNYLILLLEMLLDDVTVEGVTVRGEQARL